MEEPVVVTGAGVITTTGAGLDEFGAALYAPAVPVPGISARLFGLPAFEIADFTPAPWLGNKGIRVLDRAARLLAVASQMALTATGLPRDPSAEGDSELGLVCGTMFGGVHSIATFDWAGVTEGPSGVNPADFPNTVINSPSGHTGIRYKLSGINSTISAGLASGLQALGYAADMLRFGRVRAVLAGGMEELCEESMLGFQSTGLMARGGAIKPFSSSRTGTIPGEGAALWMLERERDARGRGVSPRWRILGFGSAHDGAAAMGLHSKGCGAAVAMREALQAASLEPGQVSCVFASANGSRFGDAAEARALTEVFGGANAIPPVCAPKAFWGEAMGASGALAALAAGLALERRALPPTPGFDETDCEGLRLSPAPQAIAEGPALINALGCDGMNVSLVIDLCCH